MTRSDGPMLANPGPPPGRRRRTGPGRNHHHDDAADRHATAARRRATATSAAAEAITADATPGAATDGARPRGARLRLPRRPRTGGPAVHHVLRDGHQGPLDRISVTYTDASGRQRTQQNVYIPWSLTVTPISMSEFGSVQASSLLRLSKLNCSITTSDGQTIASQQNNDWQTSC